MYIKGSFDSEEARLIQIQLKKCVGKTYCKTEEEIMTHFRDKWMVLLYNQKIFNTEEYGKESIQTNSRLDWVPVNTQFQ